MQKPPLDPDVADTAPSNSVLTVYDEEHIITYLRLLDADAVGADWREVARIVLHLDPEHEPDRARRAFDSHLSRAKWMTEHGYRHRYVVARQLKVIAPRSLLLFQELRSRFLKVDFIRWPPSRRIEKRRETPWVSRDVFTRTKTTCNQRTPTTK